MYRCDSEKNQFFTSESCIADAMKRAGVDKDAIDSCMSDSGGLKGDVNNTMLEAELVNRANSGVVIVPSLFINQAPIRGEMAYVTAFRAICAGYASGYEPEICIQCMHCPDAEGCVKKGHCGVGMAAEGSVSNSTFAGTMVGLTLFFCTVGYVMYRRQQRYMRDEVRGIMAQYMPIDEQNKDGDNSLALTESEGTFTMT